MNDHEPIEYRSHIFEDGEAWCAILGAAVCGFALGMILVGAWLT